MKLRYLLTLLFTVVSAVPVLILGLWVSQSALDREKAEVRERHLLLATNITAALERYSRDGEAAFDTMIAAAMTGRGLADLTDLGRRLDFLHFCLIEPDGTISEQINWSAAHMSRVDDKSLARLRGWAESGRVYSPVHHAMSGQPAIALVRALPGGRIAFAELSTAYIVQLQLAVAFGKKGHAAIVDHVGNIIGHPNPDWRQAIKNIAKVKPVAAMLQGESGVTTFFSPAMKKDMIVGYTVVPSVGWGVMVPQPFEELEARTAEINDAATKLIVGAILIAALLSWWLSGLVTRPVEAVVAAANEIATGQLNARVDQSVAFAPREMRHLAFDFNAMAARIKEDQESMAKAVDDAQKADRAKSTFVANMSHEFRTPLNAIIGFSDVMRSETLGPLGNERYEEYARDINASGQHLLAIVNDILDLSKIEAGKFELEHEPVVLPTLLTEVRGLVSEGAEQAGLALAMDIDPAMPVIHGSTVKLKQVMLNLLANAVRFTPRGGQVAIEARARAGDWVEIRVSDTGVGMTEAEIETALQPFSQVDSGLSRRYEGTGLGLPLARRLVELHGGTLEIKSEPGVGTTVALRLPVDGANAVAGDDEVVVPLAIARRGSDRGQGRRLAG